MTYRFSRRYSIGVFVLTIILIFSSCQKSTPKVSSGNEKDSVATQKNPVITVPANIGEIKKAFAETMDKAENNSLDSLSFKYSCHGETSGSVSYYSEHGNLKMVVHRYNEYDHYSAVDRYYVSDTTLYFAHRRSVAWSFESGPQGATKDNITEQRVYLIDNEPVQCLEKKYTIRSHSSNNPKVGDIENKTVDCSSLKKVVAPFKMLMKYRIAHTEGCLE